MIIELDRISKKAGLNINVTKTKILTREKSDTLKIYNRMLKEINRRITIAWKKYWSLKIS